MSESTFDLETVLRRNRPTATTGSIQIDTVDADESQVTLGFGDAQGVTYVTLTPSEAQTVATALTEAATHATADTTMEPTNE